MTEPPLKLAKCAVDSDVARARSALVRRGGSGSGAPVTPARLANGNSSNSNNNNNNNNARIAQASRQPLSFPAPTSTSVHASSPASSPASTSTIPRTVGAIQAAVVRDAIRPGVLRKRPTQTMANQEQQRQRTGDVLDDSLVRREVYSSVPELYRLPISNRVAKYVETAHRMSLKGLVEDAVFFKFEAWSLLGCPYGQFEVWDRYCAPLILEKILETTSASSPDANLVTERFNIGAVLPPPFSLPANPEAVAQECRKRMEIRSAAGSNHRMSDGAGRLLDFVRTESDLVGVDEQKRELRRLCANGQSLFPLIMVNGPTGCGKSVLVTQVLKSLGYKLHVLSTSIDSDEAWQMARELFGWALHGEPIGITRNAIVVDELDAWSSSTTKSGPDDGKGGVGPFIMRMLDAGNKAGGYRIPVILLCENAFANSCCIGLLHAAKKIRVFPLFPKAFQQLVAAACSSCKISLASLLPAHNRGREAVTAFVERLRVAHGGDARAVLTEIQFQWDTMLSARHRQGGGGGGGVSLVAPASSFSSSGSRAMRQYGPYDWCMDLLHVPFRKPSDASQHRTIPDATRALKTTTPKRRKTRLEVPDISDETDSEAEDKKQKRGQVSVQIFAGSFRRIPIPEKRVVEGELVERGVDLFFSSYGQRLGSSEASAVVSEQAELADDLSLFDILSTGMWEGGEGKGYMALPASIVEGSARSHLSHFYTNDSIRPLRTERPAKDHLVASLRREDDIELMFMQGIRITSSSSPCPGGGGGRATTTTTTTSTNGHDRKRLFSSLDNSSKSDRKKNSVDKNAIAPSKDVDSAATIGQRQWHLAADTARWEQMTARLAENLKVDSQ